MDYMKQFATPLALNEVSVNAGFWKTFMEKTRTQVIPYQWEALNDRIPGAQPSYAVNNFQVASGKKKGEYGGPVFQDSDIAKWIEAVGNSLAWHPDPELEKTADSAIDDIVAAQRSDGYLNTYYICHGLDKRFTNMRDHHELYCLGHLLEGAVAYFKATGKDKLLNALIRYVDLVDSLIGPEPEKLHGYPGHQEIELALVKLYGISGNEKHLRLAKYFIDERGRQPLFFREETEKYKNYFYWGEGPLQYAYYQAAQPVREQQNAVGHAVRAVYMYSGMADVARETGDKTLFDACCRLWKDLTGRQMYITGGIGSSHYGEAFTFGYDLPNNTMYTETCASIGLVFFAQRMLRAEQKSQYADVMEQALYNGIISGMSVDGKSFFYVNPLEALPEASEKDQLRRHVKVERQKWFGCSCCPPNIARILTSLGAYAYSKYGDTFFINLFVGGNVNTQLDSGRFVMELATDYPWDGDISITVKEAAANAQLAIRLPGWCEKHSLCVNGKEAGDQTRNGYLYITGLKPGDTVLLKLEMPVTVLEANPQVRADIGKIAVRRGPVVYCIEEADNGKDLHRIFLKKDAVFTHIFDKDFFGGAVLLESPGLKLEQEKGEDETLYRKATASQYKTVPLKWIPYYLWANRGSGEMCCWVHAV